LPSFIPKYIHEQVKKKEGLEESQGGFKERFCRVLGDPSRIIYGTVQLLPSVGEFMKKKEKYIEGYASSWDWGIGELVGSRKKVRS